MVLDTLKYQEYKKQLDEELNRSAESFVRIGYLLKVARDTNVLAESGYSTVAEFAKTEYGLNATQVSRFISINDKFSEGGYGEKLLESYRGFGYSKLTIMLQIPESINEELTPTMSKADIQAVKAEVDEERKITDIEVMIEDVPEEVEKIETKLGKVLKVLAEQDADMIRRVKRKLDNTEENFTVDTLKFEFAPDEEKLYSIRVPGIGRIMAVMKHSSGITLTEVRSGSKTWNSWEELLEEIEKLEVEEVEKIAPVQEKKSKVVRFKPQMPEPIEEEDGREDDRTAEDNNGSTDRGADGSSGSSSGTIERRDPAGDSSDAEAPGEEYGADGENQVSESIVEPEEEEHMENGPQATEYAGEHVSNEQAVNKENAQEGTEEVTNERDETETACVAEVEIDGNACESTGTISEDRDPGHTEGSGSGNEEAPRELKWPSYARRTCKELSDAVAFSKWEPAMQAVDKLKHYITRAMEEEKRVYKKDSAEEDV